jgi:murein DD-endopeptidase MepM/ murein hydrolase activator NlpD
MRKLLFLACFFLLTPMLQTEARTRSAPATPDGHGGGEYVFRDTEHLTQAQREEIQAAIRRNIAVLEKEGKLPPPTEAHPLLAWPLSPAPSVTDPTYYGIANFVDQNPAYPNHLLDYMCGTRTYDTSAGYNHSGVDIFTWPFPWTKMDNNEVQVVAAAAGTIIYKSDGNYDRSCAMSGGTWNAIYIRHADNSQAWYGHMKRGSLTSKGIGSGVQPGEYLGIVGSSGNSTGPHLHLEVYDSSGQLNEPYQGPCNSKNADSWWQTQRPYYDSALSHIGTGFAAPDLFNCPNDESPNEADVFHMGDTVYFDTYYRDQQAGQLTQISIYDPNNQLYSTWSFTSPATYAASYWYWYWTNFAPAGPTGTWRFEASYQGQILSHSFTLVPAVPSGRVPDHEGTSDQPLRVYHLGANVVTLTWGVSCMPSDTDYEVYEGDLRSIYSHEYQTCSTGGATTWTFPTYFDNSYFLVVPTNGAREGSYGRDSANNERPPGVAVCGPQLVAGCP